MADVVDRGTKPLFSAALGKKDIPARLEETLRKFSSMLEDLMRDGIPQTGKSCAFS